MVRAVVDDDLPLAEAARRFNTTSKTVAKWVERFRQHGVDGLRDQFSLPLSSPSQTPPAACDIVEALRRQRRTQAAIAAELGLSPAIISRILKRRGLSCPHNPVPRATKFDIQFRAALSGTDGHRHRHSCRIHLWTAPPAQGSIWYFRITIACSHLSGLCRP